VFNYIALSTAIYDLYFANNKAAHDSEGECHEKRGEDTMSEQKLWPKTSFA